MNKAPPNLKIADASAWSTFKESYWDYAHTAVSASQVIPMHQLVAPSVVKLVELMQDTDVVDGEFILTTEILTATLNKQFRCQSHAQALARLKDVRMRGTTHSECLRYIDIFSRLKLDMEGGEEKIDELVLIKSFISGLEPDALRQECIKLDSSKLREVQRHALQTTESHETQRKAVEFYYGKGNTTHSTRAPTSNNNNNSQQSAACQRCGKLHQGMCTAVCNFCHKVGHAEVKCRKKAASQATSSLQHSHSNNKVTTTAEPPSKFTRTNDAKDVKDAKESLLSVKCFKCDQLGHYRSNCPLREF